MVLGDAESISGVKNSLIITKTQKLRWLSIDPDQNSKKHEHLRNKWSANLNTALR